MILPSCNRRVFLKSSGLGLGSLALSTLLSQDAGASSQLRGVLTQPHHAPKAKRIIYLFMAGGPSQFETFDYKPVLNQRNGQELPDSVRQGQRLTGMSGHQATLPIAGSLFKFARHGQSGQWVSELFPWTARMVDDLCFVRSLTTEAINHDPAITFFQTGHQIAGRPSMGAWLSYGLGSANENLPAFIVLVSKDKTEQGLYARLWGNGFLPSVHQGVQFRSGKDAVLYLANPAGVNAEQRREVLGALDELHALQQQRTGDPEIAQRTAQYEMAFRMQTSVPEVMDISREPMETLRLYGPDVLKPGSFAANCLLARRLAERNVRFIQLYHPGWDHHGGLPGAIRRQAKEVDRAGYGLIQDLKRRGLLDDTLVVWGGEFGRTAYSQGKLTANDYGRDHHPRCFTMWLAGGGIKPGTSYGATDDFGYNVAENPVPVHDLQATILHLMGIDHERLTYKFQGRYYRLTDVHGHVIKPILA
jgi:hypothetical protein